MKLDLFFHLIQLRHDYFKISQLFVIIVLNQQWRADMYILVFLSLFDRFISLSYSVNLKMSKQIV